MKDVFLFKYQLTYYTKPLIIITLMVLKQWGNSTIKLLTLCRRVEEINLLMFYKTRINSDGVSIVDVNIVQTRNRFRFYCILLTIEHLDFLGHKLYSIN
ncbi:uncharacterized protein ASCRUDRAFT_143860 [Ascoidea rubescens DSM 1968]|uniref:Uncharacterized protein n=1 Tax=Ascoidea rubescens DSM 1968 TaxID=1344418 RepID=A0A1D2VJ31_9ASCO|nr:hypothetical protein ASCRUDRAFT_143860 [Ascoidea rubescens DSM 1968]ODV61638.1 hypothetical protein ASCRUDRAFT_143860 [Ascoidea rubescens DSM 1968]